MSDFEANNLRAWEAAIKSAFGAAPESATWTDIYAMIDVLQPFMGFNVNHAMLPGGGGLDVDVVTHSRETGCIRFDTGERSFYLAKPRKLSFGYVARSPANSFFLMELASLKPTDVYESVRSESEQLVEVDDEYLDYSIWEHGVLGFEDDGQEIPLPDDASVVVRLLRGNVLIVAKASLWNGDTSTYDGRHDHMDAEQVRAIIERSL
ncbi:hypothetical protein [Mesorhizobium sp. LNJC384A00]|uniref:hypothetical protein n=2 Tax=unclassified Mesorhizobium TaxID=325217 RepID=UPI0012EB4305|nr:hypothetical protein [Mesorhizobium sp. LNJC384A00]